MLINSVKNSNRFCFCKPLKYNLSVRRLKSALTRTKPLEWKTVIGLEIHAQIISKSKLFSGSKTDFGAMVNNSVSLFDAAIPGTLPVLNRRCVEAAVLAGLALDCTINEVSMFDRKHYFYADLPAGYQITQQRAPIAENGKLEFQVFNMSTKKYYKKKSIIKQIQLEQDSGKSLHDPVLERSLVDLNRAGIPLMELVFEPDLEDAEEAAALVKELILILSRLKCCSGRMEEGALRVDANVSVHLPGEPFGTRTEIKNIGSIRGVAGAIKYEAERQMKVKEEGGEIINQTMTWDAQLKATLPMRDKEEKQDYRYMPEPNLPPLFLNMGEAQEPDLVSVPLLREIIPELPAETRQRLIKTKGISNTHAVQIVNEQKLLNYFEEITSKPERKPNTVANVLINEFLTILNKNNIDLTGCKIESERLGEVCDLIQNRVVNLVTARKVLDIIANGNTDAPTTIVNDNKWTVINDEMEITKICQRIIDENDDLVDQYRRGKKKLFGALMGAVAAECGDTADMSVATVILKKLLDAPSDDSKK